MQRRSQCALPSNARRRAYISSLLLFASRREGVRGQAQHIINIGDIHNALGLESPHLTKQ